MNVAMLIAIKIARFTEITKLELTIGAGNTKIQHNKLTLGGERR